MKKLEKQEMPICENTEGLTKNISMNCIRFGARITKIRYTNTRNVTGAKSHWLKKYHNRGDKQYAGKHKI